MAIRDSIARLFGAKVSVVGLSADELADRPLEKGFDDGAILSTYRDDTWPYVCTRILAENGAMPPLVFGRLDSQRRFEAVDSTHPIQDLFDAPNPQMTGSEFRELLITYLEMVGHAPIEIVRPQAGRGSLRGNRAGTELWPHNPTWWRIVANPDGTVKGYLWIRAGQTDIAWKPENMTYLRWVNPNDRWYGQGRIAAARQPVMAEEYAAIRDKKFEKQLGVPPGILSSEMPLGDPTADLLQKRWQQAVGGYQNSGKIAILGSKTSFQAVAMNARDAQWAEQRKGRVHEIAAAFGVPMVLLLGMKDATFANAGEAVDYLWQETLQPRLNRIAETITHRLLPLLTDEPIIARFDYSDIAALNENQAEVVTRAAQIADTGVATVDEVRDIIGLEPHADKALGARQIVPVNRALTDVAALLAPPEPAPVPSQEPVPVQKIKAEESPRREAVLEPIRQSYAFDLGGYFTAQRQAALNTWKASPDDELLLDQLLKALASKRFRDRLRRISREPIEKAVTLGATEAARTLAVEVSFSIPTSEAALARVTTHLDALGVGIENTTVADVRRVVSQALADGLSHAETRVKLGELFDNYETWRLDRIARTETAAAYNLGSLGQYRTAGVELVRVTDGDGDEICAPWDGRIVTLDEAEGSPLGHPNCTRAWIPEVGR